MAVKPEGRLLAIREQIVEDKASGLTLQFELRPDGHGVLRISGPLPHGGREFVFGHSGAIESSGATTTDHARVSWLRSVGD